MKSQLFKSSAILMALTSAAIVHAADSSQVPIGLDGGALKQQIDKEAPELPSRALPTPTAPIEENIQSDQGVSFKVSAIRLEGVTLVDVDAIQDRLLSSIGKAYTVKQLQSLVDIVTAFYSERGFVIQAYLPQQTIQEDGVVLIRVLEAKLGAVVIENENQLARISNARATNYITEQLMVGQPLNMQAATRGLALINELPGINAQIALEAGSQDGETNIFVTTKRTSLIDARVETKNGGNRSTGVAQLALIANINSPTNVGDQVNFFGLYSEGTTFNQIGYARPIGYKGLRIGATANYLEYENIGAYRVNGGYGHAANLGLNASYPLKRSTTTNANFLAAYDHKSFTNRNIALDAINSHYSIQTVSLGFNANHFDNFFGGGVTNVTSNIVFGEFNIKADSPANFSVLNDRRFVPSSFQKLTFNASRVQYLPVEGAQLNVNVSGQATADELNSAEQFFLGGPFGVRAYPAAQGNGAQGVLASVELQKRLPYNLTGIAFLDAGAVQQYTSRSNYRGLVGNTDADNTYALYGSGLGLRFNQDHWNLSAVVAWKIGRNPLKNQLGLREDNDGTDTSPRAWVTGSYRF